VGCCCLHWKSMLPFLLLFYLNCTQNINWTSMLISYHCCTATLHSRSTTRKKKKSLIIQRRGTHITRQHILFVICCTELVIFKVWACAGRLPTGLCRCICFVWRQPLRAERKQWLYFRPEAAAGSWLPLHKYRRRYRTHHGFGGNLFFGIFFFFLVITLCI